MKRCGRVRNAAIVLGLVLVVLGVTIWRMAISDQIPIHVTSDRPIIVLRELSPADVAEIVERVRKYKRQSDKSALRRFGLSGAPSVLCRHFFEPIREMEIERDGSVTVLARSTRERPPTGTKPNPRYSGYGRSYRMVKETNAWQVAGTGGFTAGSKIVTISYSGQ